MKTIYRIILSASIAAGTGALVLVGDGAAAGEQPPSTTKAVHTVKKAKHHATPTTVASSTTTTTAPAPAPASVPAPAPVAAPAPAPAPTTYGGYQPGPDDPITTLPADVQAAFACIRWRESHGDPVAHNPTSSAAGLYQFLDTSWIAYGGGQFAPTADLATPQQQGQVAVWAYQQSGLSPWGGGC